MRDFSSLCISLWSILLSSLIFTTHAQSIPSTWRKPTITTSFDQQKTLAKAAIDIAFAKVNQANGLDPSNNIPQRLYAVMAQYDLLTNGTEYRDSLLNIFTILASNNAVPNQYSLGIAAMQAYHAYADTVFLNVANIAYDFASNFVISYNTTTPSNPNKQFPIQTQCNGATMAGGLFWQDTPTDPQIFSTTTSMFSLISGLLAETTIDNSDLLAGAKAASTFVRAQMFNGKFPEWFISANATQKCVANGGIQPSFSGWYIYGLSTLANITQDAGLTSQLMETVNDVVTTTQWQTTDGQSIMITTDATPIVPALAEVYHRFPSNSSLRSYLQAYISVQYNALIDLAGGTGAFANTYAANWTGPPSNGLNLGAQYQAIEVLVTALGLPNNSSPSPTSTGPSAGATATGEAIPHSDGGDQGKGDNDVTHKANTGAIAGGVVGGVVFLLCSIGGFLLWRRRKSQTRERQRVSLVPSMTEAHPFAHHHNGSYDPYAHSHDPSDPSLAVTPFSFDSHSSPPALGTLGSQKFQPIVPPAPVSSASGSSVPVSDHSTYPPDKLHTLAYVPASGSSVSSGPSATVPAPNPDNDRPTSAAGANPSAAAQSPSQPLSTEQLISMLQDRLKQAPSVSGETPPAYSPA